LNSYQPSVKQSKIVLTDSTDASVCNGDGRMFCKLATAIHYLAFALMACLQGGCIHGLFSQSANSSSHLLTGLSSESSASSALGNKESAMACLKTAQQLDSQHHGREAIALYERARGFDPKLKNVSRRLAVLYAQSKDSAKAKVEFDNAIAESPKDASLRSDAGYFFMQTGDLEKAEVHLVESRNLSQGHPQGTIHLAMLRAKQERIDESLALFSEVVGPAPAHANLGVILAKSGKRDLAIEHLEQAHQLDPSLPVPPAFLKQLRKN